MVKLRSRGRRLARSRVLAGPIGLVRAAPNAVRNLGATTIAHPLATAVFLSMTTQVVAWLVFTQRFESNDDVAMAMIADGTFFGEGSPNLVFTHVIIGEALSTLYGWFPVVSWYGVYLMGLHALALGVVVYTLLATPQFRWRRHWPLVAILIVVFYLPMWMQAQFTSTALLLCFAGVMLHVAHSGRRTTVWLPAFSAVLVWIGVLVRWRTLTAVALITAPLLIMAFWRMSRRQHLVFLGIFGALLAASMAVTALYYAGDDDWAAYFDFNLTRGLAHDISGIQDLEPDGRQLFEIGWTANDLNMFQSFFLYDREVYTEDAISHLVQPSGRRDLKSGLEKHWVTHHWQIIAAATLLGVAALVRSGRDRLVVVGVCAWTATVLVATMVFLKLPPRVAHPIWLFGALFISVYLLDGARVEEAPPTSGARRRVGSWLLAVGTAVLIGLALRSDVDISRESRDLRADFFLTSSQLSDVVGDGVVIAWPGAIPVQAVSPWDTRPFGDLQILPGGWLTNSPDLLARMDELGAADVYSAVAEDPDVFLVARSPTRFERYLHEHRDIDGMLVPIARLGIARRLAVFTELVDVQLIEASGDAGVITLTDRDGVRSYTIQDVALGGFAGASENLVGAVNYVPPDMESARIVTGWAGARGLEAPVDAVVAFFAGEPIALDITWVGRADVSRELSEAATVPVGFRLDIRDHDLEHPVRIRVFALLDGEALELPERIF